MHVGVLMGRRVLVGVVAALSAVLVVAPAMAAVRTVTPPAPVAPAPVAPRSRLTTPTAVPAPAHPAPRRLAAPVGLTVTAGDMVDALSWAPVRSSLVVGYRVERAISPTGPWTLLVARTTATTYADKVPAPRTYYYRVASVTSSGAYSSSCAPVANTALALSSIVTSGGVTLRAANGDMTVIFAAGTFSAPTRVSVRPVAGAPPFTSGVTVTPAYDFSASAALRRPAGVTMRYRIPVTHFQVATTVARAVDLMTYDSATGAWTPVTTTVDLTRSTLTADMPHFSYWTGAFIQPHGTKPSKVDYCGTVCHNLAISPIDPTAIAIRDSTVCYTCHGNTPSTLTTGAGDPTGRNVQAEFFACPGQTYNASVQSRHPVSAPGATTGLRCTLCHDPHADPVKSPKLLRALDAVTGRAVAGGNGVGPGTAYCGTCHGTRSNGAANAAASGYWARTGGDRASRFFTSAHAAVGDSSTIGIGCLNCHGSAHPTRTERTPGSPRYDTLMAAPKETAHE